MYNLTANEFKKLFDRYLPMVLSQCLKIMGSMDIAQDISTDTFLKVWINREVFKSEDHAKAYLLITCKGACLNMLKKKGTDSIDGDIIEEQTEQISSQTTNEIMKEMDHLPGKSKIVFELRVFGQMTFRAIGEKLGMKTHAVYVRYLYAVKLITRGVKIIFE